MAGHPGPRRLQTYILLISILLQQLIHAQTTSDNCFGDYGSCSQQVILPLFEATGCLCSSASCACSNQTYLFNVMADVGACCTFSELNNTAQTSIDNCINNGSPSVVSFEELLDAGKAGTTSSCPIAALATLKPSSMTSNRAQITTTTASGTRGNALTSSASEPNVGKCSLLG
jgi:hypothetical protein